MKRTIELLALAVLTLLLEFLYLLVLPLVMLDLAGSRTYWILDKLGDFVDRQWRIMERH